MSALRFSPLPRVVVTGGWLEGPGLWYLGIIHDRGRQIMRLTREMDDLREVLVRVGLHRHVPPGFWRYMQRQEGAVFYWWERGQWMRLDENTARVMRGRAQTERDGRTVQEAQ